MSEENEYESVADRQKAAQARVYTELTKRARERLAQISSNPVRANISDPKGHGGLEERYVSRALTMTYEDVGYSGVRDFVSDSVEDSPSPKSSGPDIGNTEESPDTTKSHYRFILNGDTISVLTYVEHLLEICHQTKGHHWSFRYPPNADMDSRVEDTADKINIAFETEGILWNLEYSNSGSFNFTPIGSEMMEEADHEFSVIASDRKWKPVVSPYQTARRLYKDRKYGAEIPEKLYNSIEELARTICVDLEGWENNRELNVSDYLETMRDQGMFDKNNVMHAELVDLTKSMERAFAKVGKERKKHAEIDREYATLLLHQTSAYLTYLIRRYEDEFGIES